MPTYFGTCNALGVTDFTDVDDSGGWNYGIYTGKSFVCPGVGPQQLVELATIVGILSGAPSITLALYDALGNLVCQGVAPALVVDGYVWQGHMTAADLIPAGGSAGDVVTLQGGQSYRIGVSRNSAGVLDTYNNTGHVMGDVDFGATDYTTGWPGTIPAGTDYDGWITSVRAGVNPVLALVGLGGSKSVSGARGPRDSRGFVKQRVWDYSLIAPSFQTFLQSIDVTGGTWAAGMSEQICFQRPLAVAGTWTAALGRGAAYFRALAVSTSWTTVLSRLALRSKTLATSGTFTAALAKFNTRQVAIAASGTWAVAIARAQGKLLAVASTFAPALSRFTLRLKALAVSSGFAAVLQRCITKPLAVGSTFTAVMAKGRLTLKSLAVTSAMTAAITKSFGYARSLAASSPFSAVLAKRLSLSQLLAAASPFTAAMSKTTLRRIGLAVMSVFDSILTKIKIVFGLETSSLTGNVRSYARLAGSGRSYARLDGNPRTGARLFGTARSRARLEGSTRTQPRLDGEVRNYPVAA